MALFKNNSYLLFIIYYILQTTEASAEEAGLYFSVAVLPAAKRISRI